MCQAAQLASPPHGAEQGGSRLVVEGDDDTGGWQVSVVAHRSAPAAKGEKKCEPNITTAAAYLEFLKRQ